MEDQILDNEIFENESTPQKIEYAGFWIRAGAALLDSIVMIPIFFLSSYNTTQIKSIALLIIISMLGALYKPLMEGEKGATLGKMALNLKVVGTDMNPISMSTSFVRSAPWLISSVIGLAMSISVFSLSSFQEIDEFMMTGVLMQESPLYIINTAYSFVFLVIIASVIFSQKKQGLLDKLAQTYCIRGQL